MKKVTFLRRLKKKLEIEILDPIEVEDIIKEYDTYIDEKIASGLSEEKAVESFGEVEELAQELSKPYKRNIRKEKDPIGDFTRKVMNSINIFVNEFSQKSFSEIVQFIFEICFIIFIIALCRIPVSMLINLGKDVFDILSSPLNRIFFQIWNFILEFAYFILSILVFFKIFDKRYLQNAKANEESLKTKSEKVKETKTKKAYQEKSISSPLMEVLIKSGVFFLKFISVCILFANSIYLIIFAIILGICIYLLIKGITYYGFYLVMLSLFLLGTIFFRLLFNFVIDKKSNGIVLLINIIFSILTLGAGCVLATFEVADTEFINSPPSNLNTEVLREELIMEKNTIFIGNVSAYKIDNSLKTVLVDYEYYPLGAQMRTNVTKNGNFVYLNWNLSKIHLQTELFQNLIENLKEKKVYNYYIEPTITITANEETVDLIRKNRQRYYNTENQYYSCEFVRTYTVESILKDEENSTVEPKEVIVKLSEYLEDDMKYVQLKLPMANILEEGSTYEFTFKTFQAFIDTDIEDVFRENEVISIRKTDKKGMEQRRDNSCSLFY